MSPKGISRVIADTSCEILFRMRAGPHKFWIWIRDRQVDRRMDRRFGIISSRIRELHDFDEHHPEYVHYQPASYRDLHELLNSISIRSEDVFLDLGCGMGRAVCVAAMRSFRSVIGIDIAPELCAIARQNIERVRLSLCCPDIKIVDCDAVEYKIPAKVSVIYFFNPFRGAILSTVLDSVAESLRGTPRRIRLLFYGTVSSMEFREEAGRRAWLTLDSEKRLSTGAVALTYSNNCWTA